MNGDTEMRVKSEAAREFLRRSLAALSRRPRIYGLLTGVAIMK